MKTQNCKNILILCGLLSLLVSCVVPANQVTPATLATQAPPVVLPTTKPAQPTEETLVSVTVDPFFRGEFADYLPTEFTLPATFTGGYTLPVDLTQVDNMDDVDLSTTQLDLLSANGFVVQKPSYPTEQLYTEFYKGYERMRYGDTPVFITTDAVFHVYHLVFDKMLRDLERTFFIPTLVELTSTMIAASAEQYNQLKGSALEEAALRNVAFFAVAGKLLETGDPILAEAQVLVDAELALISAANAMVPSPLWYSADQPRDLVLIEDYTQYIPRGHYTRSQELERYFRAMMWFGRMTYRLKIPLETQRALLTTQAIRGAISPQGNSALSLWQNIYDPTAFIVGKADDLGIYEFAAVSDAVFGVEPDPLLFTDEKLFEAFLTAARLLPPPQVNSMWVWIWQDQDDVTQGFRFMGQRFTLDQYVFGQMMWRNVGTLAEPRDLPKALDFFASQGSELALGLLKEMNEDKYLNFDTQMVKVTQEVSQLGIDSWTQNLYWSWLYALQPIFSAKGASYPAFMQTDAWARKDLQTAVSSWTELKHDTILYAKQVMAEMGGGPGDPPPHGYVEPNPEAFARLLSLAQMTYTGLQSRSILDQTTQSNLSNLIDELEFLLQISQKELSAETISDDDYWRIKYFGGWLEAMTTAAADPDEEGGYAQRLEDQKSPVVADVATGVDRVLEEGVGYPSFIYVVLPDEPYRVGVGMVYTYYEFIVSPQERMTDEAWRSLLESGQAPAQPDWTNTFISE